MASFNITGFLKLKGETTAVSDKFQKRDFVIDYDLDQQYPQFMQLQLTQDRCSLLDNIPLGQEIKISFTIQCKEYQPKEGGEKKYFNSVNAWRLEPTANRLNVQQPPMPAQSTAQQTGFPNSNPLSNQSSEIADDLPF